jgi:predicted dinucleotide-binding enzyme
MTNHNSTRYVVVASVVHRYHISFYVNSILTIKTMKIGIIGAGGIGLAFAKQVRKAGYDVLISNSRGPESLTGVVEQLGGNTKAATVEEAAKADVVFISLPWTKLEAALAKWPSFDGRIVIDPMNAFTPDFKLVDLQGKTSSEVVAGWLPGAKVVKAFNTLPVALLEADPHEAGGSRVITYSGDDADAKKTVGEIIAKMGFTGLDLGGLITGGTLQSFQTGPFPMLNLIKLS